MSAFFREIHGKYVTELCPNDPSTASDVACALAQSREWNSICLLYLTMRCVCKRVCNIKTYHLSVDFFFIFQNQSKRPSSHFWYISLAMISHSHRREDFPIKPGNSYENNIQQNHIQTMPIFRSKLMINM